MTVEQLLNAHGIKLASTAPGQHYTTCRCSPNRRPHNRDKKCLGVKIEADGRVCWHCCHCEWSGPEPGSGGGRELKSYIYRDADGVPRFRKVRNLPGREPRFWLERADGHGGWIKGTQGVDTKIIYRLDEVKKAISDRRHVAVVEGEKDADNLWALGIPATCNAHGASEQGKQPKWKKFHSEQLTGADLIVFNDNDAAGYAHADTACKLSVGIAKSIRRLDLTPHWPDIPTGGDVSDWLAHGHTRAELDALIEAAPDHGEPPPPPPSDPESPPTDNSDIEITRLAKLCL